MENASRDTEKLLEIGRQNRGKAVEKDGQNRGKAVEKPSHYRTILLDCFKSICFLGGATVLGLAFDQLGFTNANIIMVYILGALLTSIATSHQIYSLVSSVAGVFVFNYLFTEPRYTLMAHETGYPVTFLVMFLTAYITGSFSIRYKRQAAQCERNAREKEAAAILAENERLRANLLRTISHDLRTPLTTISGNASNLLSNGKEFSEETRQQIYTDIYNDSMWLNDLVENLLYSTRIEDGHMVLHTSAELLDDIIEDAVAHFSRKTGSHCIRTEGSDDLILVRADGRLLEQVLINMIDNAMKYTPDQTEIRIFAQRKGGMAEIRIIDNGEGIPEEEKEKIFDKFYHGSNKIADNRRSIGLGLYLCKAIVEAHGGSIQVSDNHPSGAVFCFTIPLEEVTHYE